MQWISALVVCLYMQIWRHMLSFCGCTQSSEIWRCCFNISTQTILVIEFDFFQRQMFQNQIPIQNICTFFFLYLFVYFGWALRGCRLFFPTQTALSERKYKFQNQNEINKYWSIRLHNCIYRATSKCAPYEAMCCRTASHTTAKNGVPFCSCIFILNFISTNIRRIFAQESACYKSKCK